MKYHKISDLKKNPNNPRIVKDKNYETLKESIKNNPDLFRARPIIASNRTGENIILCGNTRYQCAVDLGFKEVPAIILSLSERKEKEFIIRDNVSNGEFDYSILANEWDIDELQSWGVEFSFINDGDENYNDDKAKENNIDEINKDEVSCPKCNHKFHI